jgi:hypothetical protein
VVKNVVPEARFQMALDLRQVEVRPAAAREQFLGVMEEVEAEVEEARADLLAIHQHMLLGQVPAARAQQQHRDLLVQAVLPPLGRVERDRAAHRVAQVDLRLDHVDPGGRERILQVGHEDFRAAVERVDHHAAVARPGDLRPAILQIGRRRRDRPGTLADVPRLREEIGLLAAIDLHLALGPALQQRLARRVEAPVQIHHEGQRLGRQHLLDRRGHRAGNLHALHRLLLT